MLKKIINILFGSASVDSIMFDFDRCCCKLDTLIDEKQGNIDKLKAKRQKLGLKIGTNHAEMVRAQRVKTNLKAFLG